MIALLGEIILVNLMATEKITTTEQWDDVWKDIYLPQIIKKKWRLYCLRVIDSVFRAYLPKDPNFEFLELGCTPGGWLHYFNTEFGYKVSGLDNASQGIEITRKNLDMLGVRGDLYFGDALNYTFDRQFDVVYSAGLVEHFNPPGDILGRHVKLLSDKGYVVVSVPNLFSPFYKTLQGVIGKEWLKRHIKILPSDLRLFAQKSGLNILYCGYVGVFNLCMINLLGKNLAWWLVINFTQRVLIDPILRFFSITKESSFFSPHVLLIAVKSKDQDALNRK